MSVISKRYENLKNPALRRHFEMCEKRTLARYDAVPDEVKTHVLKALRWAKDHMMRKEGEGHLFSLYRKKDGSIGCAFMKPEWSADHCSDGMPTGAEAIVRAVCEYESGY
jgi:hypothetical protein